MKKTLGVFMSLLMAILSVVPCFASDAGSDFAYETLNDGTVKITEQFLEKKFPQLPMMFSPFTTKFKALLLKAELKQSEKELLTIA